MDRSSPPLRPPGPAGPSRPSRPARPGNRAFGDAGEDAVARWYEQAGYEVVDRNWRCREGELDLVVVRHRVLVFCEVKARRSDDFGTPTEAVTAAKRRRIRGLAAAWLAEHHPVVREVRFDVAAVTVGEGGGLVIEVVEGAF